MAIRPLLLFAGAIATAAVRDVRSLSIQADAPYSRVEVQGRCLPASATTALGAPPRNAGDWQLQDLQESATAVWVAGTRPAGCAGEATDTTTYVVRARVFLDTVRVEAENTRRTRLYLVGALR